jgi:transcriptional regulator with XRE-family HTH domain
MNGQKLRIIREFRNYSQEHIANRLGISQNAYSRIENNQTKVTTDRLRQLAAILGVPPEDLLSDKDPVIHFAATRIQIPASAPSPATPPATSPSKEEHWQERIDKKIAFLENEINALREERKKIMQVIERLIG